MTTVDPDVPTGHYCYGYVPKLLPGETESEHKERVERLPLAEQILRMDEMFSIRWCKHWQLIEGGRVYCHHLGFAAVGLSEESNAEAQAFYKLHPEQEQKDRGFLDSGFLLGDAVKVCRLNPSGKDFEFPE